MPGKVRYAMRPSRVRRLAQIQVFLFRNSKADNASAALDNSRHSFGFLTFLGDENARFGFEQATAFIGCSVFHSATPESTAEFQTDLSPAMFPATPRPEKAVDLITLSMT